MPGRSVPGHLLPCASCRKDAIMENTAISSIIDLTGISTYGELKTLLPGTGTGRVPGIRQLRKNAECVLCRETGCGCIEIFRNGYFIYTEFNRETVLEFTAQHYFFLCLRNIAPYPQGRGDMKACKPKARQAKNCFSHKFPKTNDRRTSFSRDQTSCHTVYPGYH